MKNLLFSALLLCSTVQAQTNQFSYLFNQSLQNPAFGGLSKGTNVYFSGANVMPFKVLNQQTLIGEAYVGKKLNEKNAIDLYFNLNNTGGEYDRNVLGGSYARSFLMKKGRSINLGVRMNYIRNNFTMNSPSLNTFPHSDILNSSDLIGTLGFVFDSKNLQLGITQEFGHKKTEPVNLNNFFYPQNESGFYPYIQYGGSFFIGSKHKIGKNLEINPSYLANLARSLPTATDYNLKVTYANRFSVILNQSNNRFFLANYQINSTGIGASFLMKNNIEVGLMSRFYGNVQNVSPNPGKPMFNQQFILKKRF